MTLLLEESKVIYITNGYLLFVMGSLILEIVQKCEVKTVTKDIVKSKV